MVHAIMKVASGLAHKFDEKLEASSVLEEHLVTLLSQGWWANRISLLAAVRYAIEKAAPATATRMKAQRAFRDFDDWRSLWQRFGELGEPPRPPMPPPPKPRFNVLGVSWTQDEFTDSAADGPSGQVVLRIQEAVILDLDVAALRNVDREKIQARLKGHDGGSGKGTGTKKRIPEEYLKMIGAVGEHFVYLQLKAICEDFDSTNWRSTAKTIFGYGEGDDTLGYDFDYRDIGGNLTGGKGPSRCLIEVKSTASVSGETFEMSINEWEVAQRCYDGRENGVYVIIRVANTADRPYIADLLINPVELHLRGVLDYSSRDLLVAVGKRTEP